MNEEPSSQQDASPGFDDLEQLFREAAPRQLPQELRGRILESMAEPVASPRIIRFPLRLAAAAAVLFCVGLSLLMMHRDAGTRALPVVTASPAPDGTIEPVAVSTSEMASQPVGPLIDVDGRPVRLMKSYELATHTFQDSDTGALVNVSYPQTRYQFVPASIQ